MQSHQLLSLFSLTKSLSEGRENPMLATLQDSSSHCYYYSTLLVSKHKIQSFLEKATTLFKLKVMFCFLGRLVSSSAGLTQARLYPGKCG